MNSLLYVFAEIKKNNNYKANATNICASIFVSLQMISISLHFHLLIGSIDEILGRFISWIFFFKMIFFTLARNVTDKNLTAVLPLEVVSTKYW